MALAKLFTTRAITLALASILPVQYAQAYEFDTGDSDVKATWNNTFKYSTAYRLKDADASLLNGTTSGLNQDDGDRNFRNKGFISNRIDWLSELDVGTKDLGFRVSAAAWYDSVYNSSNQNNSASTNAATVNGSATNQFTSSTRTIMGRDISLMDAFVYAKGEIDGTPGTLRIGRHSLQYGETLFFGANGIANAQGPIDLVKLLSVPGSQYKEILLPVNQISGQLQIKPNLSVGGYYQFEWRPTTLPPVGSYLSTYDAAGAGATAYLNGTVGSGIPAFTTIADMKAKNSGQGGAQLKFTPEGWDTELGFYAAQYHDKTPNYYLGFTSAGVPESLQAVYAENIRTVGMSASTVLGGINVAGEVSVRRNAPLVSDLTANTTSSGSANNSSNPAYAVGNTAHANLSAIYVMPTNPFFQGGSLLGELAWNRTTSVTNKGSLDPNTTRDATAVRLIFAPAYYQVITGMDITVPIGIGYTLDGRSSAVTSFNGGGYHTGDLSIGINGTYQQDWKFGLNYVHYLGAAGTFLTTNSSTNAVMLSYAQALKDRDFISFNIQRSF